MYSTDVLVSCLQQMEREDIARLIQSDEAPLPVVFISYQWHSQVKNIIIIISMVIQL